jgi:hypothetical protein
MHMQDDVITDTGSSQKVGGHHQLVLSVAIGVSCTFVVLSCCLFVGCIGTDLGYSFHLMVLPKLLHFYQASR